MTPRPVEAGGVDVALHTAAVAWEWVAPVATAGVSIAAVVATYLAARKTVNTQAQTARETRDHERQMAELARARDREQSDRDQRLAAYADCLTAIRAAGTTWQQLTNDARNEIRTALVRVELLGTSTVARKADIVLDLVSHEDITSPVSLEWIEEQLLDAMREDLTGESGLALERAAGRVRRERTRADDSDAVPQ